MALELVTAASVYPLTESEVWDHLRVPLVGSPAEPADKTYIAALLAAVTSFVDGRYGYLNRALIQQTWDYHFDHFPASSLWNPRAGFQLPLPPLQSVTSISYYDENDVQQTLSTDVYEVDAKSEPGRIQLKWGQFWPSTYERVNAVTVRFVAGYAGDGASPEDLRANIPEDIKHGMKIFLGHLYQNRSEVEMGTIASRLPFGAEMLLGRYKTWTF